MSCGGSKSTNANAATISDSVKNVNRLVDEPSDDIKQKWDEITITDAEHLRKAYGNDVLLEDNIVIPLTTAMVNQSLRRDGARKRVTEEAIERIYRPEYERVYAEEISKATTRDKLLDKIPHTARALEEKAAHTDGPRSLVASAGAAILGGAPEENRGRTPLEQRAHRRAASAAMSVAIWHGPLAARDPKKP